MWIWPKKRGGEGFQVMDLQGLMNTTPEGSTEDNLLEMSASESGPEDEEDIEETVPGNKLTSDYPAEGFQSFKTAFDYFYNMGPSIIWVLKLKQMMEKLRYTNIFREMKK